jgi:hypothetical protein
MKKPSCLMSVYEAYMLGSAAKSCKNWPPLKDTGDRTGDQLLCAHFSNATRGKQMHSGKDCRGHGYPGPGRTQIRTRSGR